jgi:hypothetical protein
MEYRLEAG